VPQEGTGLTGAVHRSDRCHNFLFLRLNWKKSVS
jgi:hypothetical protein